MKKKTHHNYGKCSESKQTYTHTLCLGLPSTLKANYIDAHWFFTFKHKHTHTWTQQPTLFTKYVKWYCMHQIFACFRFVSTATEAVSMTRHILDKRTNSLSCNTVCVCVFLFKIISCLRTVNSCATSNTSCCNLQERCELSFGRVPKMKEFHYAVCEIPTECMHA